MSFPFQFSALDHSIRSIPSGVFSPIDIAGLTVWLDAGIGITKDGGNLVSNWADQSGNSNDVVQATGSYQPLWTASEQNGEPGVVFDGTDNFMQDVAWTGGTVAQPFYAFIVLTSDSNVVGTKYNLDAGAATNRGFFYYDGSINIRFGQGTDTILEARPTGYNVLTIFVNGASSIYRRNGTQVGSTLSLGTASQAGLTLGSSYVPSAWGNSRIAEYLFYAGDIGTTDRGRVETYLKDKYAL